MIFLSFFSTFRSAMICKFKISIIYWPIVTKYVLRLTQIKKMWKLQSVANFSKWFGLKPFPLYSTCCILFFSHLVTIQYNSIHIGLAEIIAPYIKQYFILQVNPRFMYTLLYNNINICPPKKRNITIQKWRYKY